MYSTMFNTLLLVAIFYGSVVATCPTGCSCYGRAIECRGLTSLPPSNTLLSTLRLLNFSGGSIGEIPPGYFSHIKNAELIDLSNNHIVSLGSRAFQGLHRLRWLDLSNNRISVIPKNALAEISGPTSCNANGLECKLILTGNDITTIEANALSWVKRLQIIISGSGDLDISSYAFYGSRNIPLLHISDFLSVNMRKRMFTNTENVGRIEVMRTSLHSIRAFNFEGLKNVNSFQFHHVHFAEIEAYGFAGIHYTVRDDNVTYSRLNSTNPDPAYVTMAPDSYPLLFNKSTLISIPTDCFEDTNLKGVLFVKNRIERIEEYAFRGLLNLKSLVLVNNTVITLEEGALGELRNTEELVMHHNHMSTLTSKAFHNTQGLKILSIRIRPMQSLRLGSAAFSGLQEVDMLAISGTPGVTSHLSVAPDAFHAMGGIVEIRISHVTLPVLERDAFRGITKVGVLRFEHCNISRIDRSAFGQDNRPGTVYALDLGTGNKFLCDCSLNEMLREFERRFTNFEVSCKDKSGKEKIITANSRHWAECHKNIRSHGQANGANNLKCLPGFSLYLAIGVIWLLWCKLSRS